MGNGGILSRQQKLAWFWREDWKLPKTMDPKKTTLLLLAFFEFHIAGLAKPPPGTPLRVTTIQEDHLLPWNNPVVGPDGTVYFGMGHSLLAVDGQNGKRLWMYTTEGGVHGSPAIGTDGTAYIGSQDKRLYAVDGKTGALKWSFETHGGINSTPAIDGNGVVYFGNSNGWFYAIEGETGTALWAFRTGATMGIASPVVGQYGYVYVPCFNGYLYAVDMASGELGWELNTGGALAFSTPAVGPDGTLYFGSHNAMIYAVDGKDGSVIWEVRTAGGVHSSPVVGQDGKVYLSTAHGWDDLATHCDASWKGSKCDEADYYIEYAPYEYCYGGATVDLDLGQYSGGDFEGSPGTALAAFVILSGIFWDDLPDPGGLPVPKGGIYALDGKTGKILWARNSYSAYASPVLGPDGTLYYQSKKMYMLDSQSWATLWESSGRSQYNQPAIGPDGTAFVLWKGNRGSNKVDLYALEGTTRIEVTQEQAAKGVSETSGEGQWHINEWQGTYYQKGGQSWFFHFEHGWLYRPENQAEGDFWAWDGQLGWVWFCDGHYPYLYRQGHGWIYYREGSASPRWFYDFTNETWLDYPVE